MLSSGFWAKLIDFWEVDERVEEFGDCAYLPSSPAPDDAIYVDSSRPGTRVKLLRQLVMRACKLQQLTRDGARKSVYILSGGWWSFSTKSESRATPRAGGSHDITRKAIRDSYTGFIIIL